MGITLYKIVAGSVLIKYLGDRRIQYSNKEDAKEVIRQICDERDLEFEEEDDLFKNLKGGMLYRIETIAT